MLLRFTCQNFMSFRDEVVLDLQPSSKEQNHVKHLLNSPKGDVTALRAAALYGANASGKSNLVKAFTFVQDFVEEAPRKGGISVKPFRLDAQCMNQPSVFSLEFLLDNMVFEFGFAVTSEQVVEEWLYRKGPTDQLLYERSSAGEPTITSAGKSFLNRDQSFLKVWCERTPPNCLMLTEGARIEIPGCVKVWSWIVDSLLVVPPHARYRDLEKGIYNDPELGRHISQLLRRADTGIQDISVKKMQLPDQMANVPLTVLESIARGEGKVLSEGLSFEASPPKGVLYLMNTKRKQLHSEEFIEFELAEESDGTIQLLHLAPLLYMCEKKNCVFIVDEIDRSLHPLLSRLLIEQFLAGNGNSQVIFTTHETNLLDLELLRRDSIHFTAKNQEGASELYSLVDFDVRKDLKIERNYLKGRFGAIPFLGDAKRLGIDMMEHST